MLFSMAEQCDALRFTMIAFSAVIYSIANVDISARERALSTTLSLYNNYDGSSKRSLGGMNTKLR